MSNVTTHAKGTRFNVSTPVERNGKTYWSRVGAAFANGDGSVSVVLDSLPLNGKLHLALPSPKDDSAS
ncbi:hypothetical protein QEG98_41985 (plasmid) [Myxococcus sp. MxC21-1]|uniref:hypothetical protein n=1 Tax=Myxococcus sp. MxC21-1 TaxID=3041439 RepID=UPI002930B034|nr:hypothetical protein [Myxococcus sp. MxC21-1]WNZ66239.1 hypothetical protein QEG98_41985 [Myxococcus sp. MxC21-1]